MSSVHIHPVPVLDLGRIMCQIMHWRRTRSYLLRTNTCRTCGRVYH